MRRKPISRTRCTVALVVFSYLTGCTSNLRMAAAPTQDQLSAELRQELRQRLDGYSESFEAAIEKAADEIREGAPGSPHARAAVQWRVKMVDMCRDAVAHDDEIHALLQTWTVAERMQQFFETGDGRSLFGEQQALAIHASRELLREIERIASEILPADVVRSAGQQIVAYAREFPLRGMFGEGDAPPFVRRPEGADVLRAILSAPLRPFTALGRIGGGVGKALDLPSAVDRFTQAVRGLPEDSRWQLDALLSEMQEGPTLVTARETMQRFTENSTRVANAADELPARLRAELERLVDDLEGRETNLRGVIGEARQLVDSADRSLRDARETADVVRGAIDEARATVQDVHAAAQPLESMAGAVGAAARDLTALVRPPAPPVSGGAGPIEHAPPRPAKSESTGEHSPPFDINDYARTADSITKTVVELRGAISDLKGLLAQRPLAQPLDEANAMSRSMIDLAAARAQSVANATMWRLAGLLVLTFVLALVYRAVAARWQPARRTG